LLATIYLPNWARFYLSVRIRLILCILSRRLPCVEDSDPGDLDDAIARHKARKEAQRHRRSLTGRLIQKSTCMDCARIDELDATYFPRSGERFDPTAEYRCPRCKGLNVRVLVHP